MLWCTASLVYGQQFGTVKENLNLPLQLEECTGAEDCKAGKQTTPVAFFDVVKAWENNVH